MYELRNATYYQSLTGMLVNQHTFFLFFFFVQTVTFIYLLSIINKAVLLMRTIERSKFNSVSEAMFYP